MPFDEIKARPASPEEQLRDMYDYLRGFVFRESASPAVGPPGALQAGQRHGSTVETGLNLAALPLAVGRAAQPTLLDRIRRMSFGMSRDNRSMQPDLANAGAEAAVRQFGKRFPGTDPLVMEDLGAGEKTSKLLAQYAKGGMAKHMAEASRVVTEPQAVAQQRRLIRHWESLLEQKFGNSGKPGDVPGMGISDEAIARGSKLPLDTVRKLRADPGYRASIDPIRGSFAESAETVGPVRARVIKNPEPDAPKPDLDPIRAAMARTDLQRKILELYEQDVPIAEIARQTKMDPGNARRQLDKMIERGKRANEGGAIRPVTPPKPISGGGPAKAEYAHYQEGYGKLPGFHNYNLAEDFVDAAGVRHPKGTTKSETFLIENKIPYDRAAKPISGGGSEPLRPFQERHLQRANERIDRINERNAPYGMPPIGFESLDAPNAPRSGAQPAGGTLPLGHKGHRDAKQAKRDQAVINDMISGGTGDVFPPPTRTKHQRTMNELYEEYRKRGWGDPLEAPPMFGGGYKSNPDFKEILTLINDRKLDPGGFRQPGVAPGQEYSGPYVQRERIGGPRTVPNRGQHFSDAPGDPRRVPLDVLGSSYVSDTQPVGGGNIGPMSDLRDLPSDPFARLKFARRLLEAFPRN